MTPMDSQARHLKYGRFGRRDAESFSSGSHGRRRGHWTGYRPLEDSVTQERLAALVEAVDEEVEERE